MCAFVLLLLLADEAIFLPRPRSVPLSVRLFTQMLPSWPSLPWWQCSTIMAGDTELRVHWFSLFWEPLSLANNNCHSFNTHRFYWASTFIFVFFWTFNLSEKLTDIFISAWSILFNAGYWHPHEPCLLFHSHINLLASLSNCFINVLSEVTRIFSR